jgi:hypothetical protein
VDDDDRRALREAGRDPEDPHVAAAMDFVRWELAMFAHTLTHTEGTDT